MARVLRIFATLFVAALYVSAARAQDADQPKNDPRAQPVSPDAALLLPGDTTTTGIEAAPEFSPATTAEDQSQDQAEDQPLSGVQGLTPTPNLRIRSLLVPSISLLSQVAFSSSSLGYEQPAMYAYTVGMLDWNHSSDRSDFLMHYTGGEMFSTYLNSAIQDIEFSENYRWQRWSLLAGDEAGYLSQSPFGFGGIGDLGFLGGAQIAPGGALAAFFNAELTPNQSIPTFIAPRFSNTMASQVEYQLSPRSSWTVSGSYGTLQFVGVGFINNSDVLFQTGYNYSLSPHSTIAVIYRFDDFWFTRFPEAIQNHVAELSYGRSLTGRLTFQLAAGPSVEVVSGFLTGPFNHLSWALDSALNYQLNRTTVVVRFDRLVTGGSGVLLGAQTSQLQAMVQRTLTPRWRGSVSLGYAANQYLIPNAFEQPYNSWYAAVRSTHQLRPGISLLLAYGAQLQATYYTACAIPANCGATFISNQFSAGLNIDLRPAESQ
jgi:hypothetical protein